MATEAQRAQRLLGLPQKHRDHRGRCSRRCPRNDASQSRPPACACAFDWRRGEAAGVDVGTARDRARLLAMAVPPVRTSCRTAATRPTPVERVARVISVRSVPLWQNKRDSDARSDTGRSHIRAGRRRATPALRGRVGRRPRHRRPPVGARQAQPAAAGGSSGGAAAGRGDSRRRCSATRCSCRRRCRCGVSAAVQPVRGRRHRSAITWTTRSARCRDTRIASARTSRPRCSSADPDEYDGGELLVEDTYGVHSVKLPAGHLVLYPSTSLHHVRPVTRGARVASFFWIQSMVRDDGQRTLLFDLDTAIQRIEPRRAGPSVGRAADGRVSQPAAAVGGAVAGYRLRATGYGLRAQALNKGRGWHCHPRPLQFDRVDPQSA